MFFTINNNYKINDLLHKNIVFYQNTIILKRKDKKREI